LPSAAPATGTLTVNSVMINWRILLFIVSVLDILLWNLNNY
jgi:hypothetical protein